MIVTEATNISQQGQGYAFTPGIYTDEQVAGWRKVTDAVHAKGGHIFCQLWHVGRISHPSLQPGGQLPVAPSAIKPEGKAFTETGFRDHVTPRALETDEIPGIVKDYAHAAECAAKAGFDGVEIHAANSLICSTSSSGTARTSGLTATAVRWKTGSASCLRSPKAVTGVLGGDRVGIQAVADNAAGRQHAAG